MKIKIGLICILLVLSAGLLTACIPGSGGGDGGGHGGHCITLPGGTLDKTFGPSGIGDVEKEKNTQGKKILI